jgi:hypothetical protein
MDAQTVDAPMRILYLFGAVTFLNFLFVFIVKRYEIARARPGRVHGLHHQGFEGHDGAQHGQHDAQQHGKVAWPHARACAQFVSGRTPGEGNAHGHEHETGEKVFLTLDLHGVVSQQ